MPVKTKTKTENVRPFDGRVDWWWWCARKLFINAAFIRNVHFGTFHMKHQQLMSASKRNHCVYIEPIQWWRYDIPSSPFIWSGNSFGENWKEARKKVVITSNWWMLNGLAVYTMYTYSVCTVCALSALTN